MKNAIILLLTFTLSYGSYSQSYTTDYFKKGVAKSYLKDYRGAMQDYNKAIDIDPKHKNAYYGRGIAKYRLKDINGACLDWSKAGELGNNNAYDMIKKYCN